MENINKLVEKLMKYKEAYYNGNPLIPDEEFDFEERKLKKLDPNNEYFRKVGFNVGSRDIKIEHEVPMLSMQKVQTADDADKWIQEIYNVPGLVFPTLKYGVWIDPKIDGISGKIVYDSNGNFKYASTRGNGKIGAIIPFGDKIKTVPKKFIPNSELRGEFFISKRNKKHFDGPLRNCCAGLLKRKEFTEESEYIEFIIYDVHTYSKSNEIIFSDRLDKLNKIEQILQDNDISDYRIVPVEKTDDIYEVYDRYNKKLRKLWDFETDGLVMTVDGGQDNYNLINSKYIITSFNRFNMALKPPAECAESVIIGIDTFVNRQRLSFVARLKPIYLNGVLVQAATLDNYIRLRENKIGIGSRVLVKRSNDVIPKIIESYNDEGSNVKIFSISKCPCCGKPLTLFNRDLICTNEYGCRDIYESKLNFMVSKLEIKNIGPAIIKSFVDIMIRNKERFVYSDFFRDILDSSLRYKYFYEATGNSDKLAKLVSDSIETTLKNGITELQIMSYFNIHSIGEKQLLAHKIYTFKDMINYCKTHEKSVIQSAFDAILIEWCKDKTHIDDLLETIELLKPWIKKEEVDPNSKYYCISGEVHSNLFNGKKELIKYIIDLNPKYKYTDNVKQGLNMLISEEDETVKVMKAKRYHIPVYSPEEAIKIIENDK